MGRARGGADQLLYGDEIRDSLYKNYTKIDKKAFDLLDKIYDHHMYDMPKDNFSEYDDEMLLVHQIDLGGQVTLQALSITLNIYSDREDSTQFALQACLHFVGSDYRQETFWQGSSFGAGLDACRKKGDDIIKEFQLENQQAFPISDQQALDHLQKIIEQNAEDLLSWKKTHG